MRQLVVSPAQGRLPLWAWCYEPVAGPVRCHGVTFHAGCRERRASVLGTSPEALADFVVDHLGVATEYHQAPC